jgi:nuclear cap-binding protein subunit 2
VTAHRADNIFPPIQNKKRKYDRDDDREGRERSPEEPAEDPLKDATTLYVGNL